MKKSHMLNLPYRADTVLPAEVAAALVDVQGTGILAFGQPPDRPNGGRAALRPAQCSEIQTTVAKQVAHCPAPKTSPIQPLLGDNYICGNHTAR